MRSWKVLLIAAVSSGLLASCSAVEKSSTALESTEEESTAPGVESSPFYLVVKSKYQTAADTTTFTEKVCTIGATDAAGTTLACDVSIPELRLHYSDISFTIGVPTTTSCNVVNFKPYYYLKTNLNTTIPGNTTATDCTTLDSAMCYGGSAESIVSNAGFTFDGPADLFYVTNERTEETYTATALSERSQESDILSLGYNIDIANNLIDRDTAKPAPAMYAGSASTIDFRFQDYQFECLDKYHEATYTIILTISDMDTPTAEGTLDQRYDWD